MASTRLDHDKRTPVEVINDMLRQGAGGGGARCTFACQAAFDQSRPTASVPPKPAAAAPSRRHDPTLFRTTFKTPLQLDLKIESASKNVAGLGPYAPPSSHDFRPTDDGQLVDDEDFHAKFTLPSNQDLRRQIAQDQEGYLKGASLKNVTCDRYYPRQDGKPDFRLQLPHTTSKTGNLNLRLQVTLDQAGLFHGGQSIRDHHFRRDDAASSTHDTPRFELEFKPTGKGYGCVDIGSKRRPDSITQ